MKGLEEFLMLAVGAVAGTYSRYKIVDSPMVIGALPVNVLIVNVVGSFLLGAFSVVSIAMNLDARYSLLIAIGFCGSLTTMSSFALETHNLIEISEFGLVALNIVANVGLSILALMGGRGLATALLGSL